MAARIKPVKIAVRIRRNPRTAPGIPHLDLLPGLLLLSATLALLLFGCKPQLRRSTLLEEDPRWIYLVYGNRNTDGGQPAPQSVGSNQPDHSAEGPSLPELPDPYEIIEDHPTPAPDAWQQWNDLAVSYARIGELAHAEELFQYILTLPLTDPAPYLNLSRLYSISAAGEGSFATFKLLAENNKIPLSRLDATVTRLRDDGRDQEAIWLLNAWEGSSRADGSVSLRLGYYLIHRGEYRRAEPVLKRALQKDPKSPEVKFALGYLMFRQLDQLSDQPQGQEQPQTQPPQTTHRSRKVAEAEFKPALELLEASLKGGTKERYVCEIIARIYFQQDDLKALLALLKRCPLERRTVEPVRMAGELILQRNYRSDLTSLKQYLPVGLKPAGGSFIHRLFAWIRARRSSENDWDYLIRSWYGGSTPRDPGAIYREFDRLY